MKYYIHKETNEPMGLINCSLIDLVGDKINSKYPTQSEQRESIYLVIFPNRQLGNGIQFHSIKHSTLQKFKRVDVKTFKEICPDFGQYRHKKDTGQNLDYFLGSMYEVHNRKAGFGI
jgi:hypothetical protein